MSKKHSKQIPQRPQPSGPTALSGIWAKLAATSQASLPVVHDQAVSWNESEVLALREVLSAEQQERFAPVIERNLCALGSAMHKAIARAKELEEGAVEKMRLAAERTDAAEKASEQSAMAIANEKAELETIRRVTKEQQALIAERERATEEKELALTRMQIDLERQAQDIRDGLRSEQLDSLRGLQHELVLLRDERERLQLSIREERQALLESARRDAEQIRSLVMERDQELQLRLVDAEKRDAAMDTRDSLLKSREQRFSARRAALADEIQTRIDEERAALQCEHEQQARDLEETRAEVRRLEVALQDERRARRPDGRNPQQLWDEVLRLQREVDLRNEELEQLRMGLESGDPKELRRRADDLQEKLARKETALAALETQKHHWELGVFERQRWQQSKQVMEAGNRLLDERVLQLQSQVDDLSNRHKASSIFPELTRMDRELTIPAHTDQVPGLKFLTDDLRSRMSHAGESGQLRFRDEDIQLFIGGLAMSQLHILQGISGTGKTSLATAFAKAVGAELTVIAVQAGWRDRADLLGYFNAFERKFYELKTLQAIYRAQTEQDRDRLHVVLLDEMNLSRPEQYFADFLSALEGEGAARHIRLVDNVIDNAPKALVDSRDIALPRNVWFMGTANQDETTNSFADKTHDRAFVLEVPRPNPDIPDVKRPKSSKVWSVSSLMRSFDDAENEFADAMRSQLDVLNRSALATYLTQELQVGWGARLERQWKRFVPVVVGAGGSQELAVDHLLQSRIIRDGKVTGRHDVSSDQLAKVRSALLELWHEWNFKDEPRRCLDSLSRNERRMGREG
jgi:hypothetical protein